MNEANDRPAYFYGDTIASLAIKIDLYLFPFYIVCI